MVIILGTLLISCTLSSLCTVLQLYLLPYRPVLHRSLIGNISRGMLADLLLVDIAIVFS